MKDITLSNTIVFLRKLSEHIQIMERVMEDPL